MKTTPAYAALSSCTPLVPFTIQRREPTSDDVQIEILYCEVCHSDIHEELNEWKATTFPIVPGHEIIGKVTQIGGKVSKFKAGDLVGVGCFVDSCGQCPDCLENLEQYCNHLAFTYNGPDSYTGGVKIWRLYRLPKFVPMCYTA